MNDVKPTPAREVVENCLSHFRLLHTFATANGPIVKHGHGKIGKAKVIAEECQHAIENLTDWLEATK